MNGIQPIRAPTWRCPDAMSSIRLLPLLLLLLLVSSNLLLTNTLEQDDDDDDDNVYDNYSDNDNDSRENDPFDTADNTTDKLDAFGAKCGEGTFETDDSNTMAFQCSSRIGVNPQYFGWRSKMMRSWDDVRGMDAQIADRRSYQAKPGDFPSYVRILCRNSPNQPKSCSGVLVSPDMVLASAVCINNYSGSYSCTVTAGHGSMSQVRNALGACLAPKEFPDKVYISYLGALVKLTKPFEYNKFVQPACLSLDKQHKDNATCFAVRQLNSKVVAVPMKRTPCEKEYEKFHNCYNVAGGESSAQVWRPCDAEEGSPMYCMSKCSGGAARQVAVGVKSPSSCVFVPGMKTYRYNDNYKRREELKKLASTCSDKLESKEADKGEKLVWFKAGQEEDEGTVPTGEEDGGEPDYGGQVDY